MTSAPGPFSSFPGLGFAGLDAATEADRRLPSEDAPDVVDLLVRDHRDVEAIFGELEKPGVNPQRRRDLVHVVIAELMRHSTAEEQHLYPAVRDYLPGGDRMADHEIAEHAQAEAVMSELMKLEATDDAFEHLLAKLISDIRHHVGEEERELFPRLREGCDRTTLVAIGEKVLAAERSGPTRPHPGAPDTPPLNRLAAPVVGAVDRARDALGHRPTTRDEVPDEG